MEAIENIIREVAGRSLDIRYAILSHARGVLASNMSIDEARRLLAMSRPISSALAVGETLFKRGREGASLLFFKAGEGLLIVLSGPWAPQSLLASCARAIYEAKGEELKGPEVREGELALASTTPRVAWGKTVFLRLNRDVLRLLAQMDGRTTVEELARKLGMDLRRACDIVMELFKAGALVLRVEEES